MRFGEGNSKIQSINFHGGFFRMFKTLSLATLSLATLPLAFLLLVATPHQSVYAEEPLVESEDLDAVKKKLKMSPTETAIFVSDMHCGGCAKKVARKLYGVKGVVKVRTDLKLDVAVVTPQKDKKLDNKQLWAATDSSGISPVKIVGPEGAYVEESEAETAQQPVRHDHPASKNG
jgi:copper chaperone CopZ